MPLLDLVKFLKDLGIARAAKCISLVAWVLLPFWIWMIMAQSYGSVLFTPSVLPFLVFPGLVLLFVETIFIVGQSYFWKHHEFKIMKLVESSARALFEDPGDKQKAENFKVDLRKFILPFTLHLPFMLSGVRKFVELNKWTPFQLSTVYASFSLAGFSSFFQREIEATLEALATLSTNAISPQLINWPIQNPMPFLGILWILSLYSDQTLLGIRQIRRVVNTKSTSTYAVLFLLYLVSVFNMLSRLAAIISSIVLIPTKIMERKQTIVTQPFVDPLTLPEIVQKTILNVEGKSCDVSRWGEKVDNESDVEKIKKDTLADRNSPLLLKIFALSSSSKDLLERIQETRPITYLGIEDKRCVFLGLVAYDPRGKVRVGRFYFETSYLKDEFTKIYEMEVERRREIERKLPSQLEGLIKELIKKRG